MSGRPATIPDTAPQVRQVDMKALFRAIGHGPGAADAPPWRRAVQCHHDGPVDVHDVQPLTVTAVVDGTQWATLAHRIDERPITLHHVSAAAVDGLVGVASMERLYLAASRLDADWCRQLPEGIPVVELDGVSPQAVAQGADETVDLLRRRFEQTVTERALETVGGPVLVDGSIRELGTIDDGIVGVVKAATDTQMLGDERELRHLRPGHRSSRFVWQRDYASQHDVHCAYLRLHAPGWHDPWTHGIVRLEALDPQLLDPLGALCLLERQDRHSGDPRWPVHLRSVRHTEEILKARQVRMS